VPPTAPAPASTAATAQSGAEQLAGLAARVTHPTLRALLPALAARAAAPPGEAVAYHEDSPGTDD
jgi:hypothetical protein